ncbi:MAG TPA: RagB/SusD family nutrient uptake outer membrane protein, partial [Chitinophagaceae bacterium]|nr:RagB/SusD family nutrient uptake outer membrane protein [Chitinophagaceae bacterium]
MKKIYILSSLLALAAVSCKKSFIELAPLDSPSPGTFFKTEAQLRQGVTAAYVPLRDLETNDFYMCEMRSDNAHYQPYPSNRGTAYVQKENVSDFVDDPTNAITNSEYFACYSGIARTNSVIGRVDAVAMKADARNDIDGQAKFLRAFYYFKLVRLFGAVPLYLKEVVETEDAFLPRSTVDQVYTQIVSDAQDAVKELAAPAKFPQTGQATKGSATILLADIYMTQKKYAEAEALLITLPAMGYGLNTNYADAFLTTNKNSKESLFEVQYLEGTAAGTQPSNFIYQFLPRTSTTTLITGTATNTSTTGGYDTPTQDLINSYEPGDKRLDASIAVAEGTYNASDLLAITANKSIVGYTPAAGKVGIPYAKKYLHTPHVATNNTNDNWPIYRYADALLLLAEAQNEQSKPGPALINLNLVRARAGLIASTETDQAKLRGILAHERRIELAFENHRWHDLVRTGTAVTVMSAYAIF